MSVMTRNPDGSWQMPGPVTGRPGQMQREAVINQLAPSDPMGGAPAAPAPGMPASSPTASRGAASSSAFQRGGQVTQLPGSGRGEAIGNMVGGMAAETAGRQLAQSGVQAGSSGLRSALTSGAGGAAAGAGVGIATGLLADKLRKQEEMPTFGGEFGHITDAYGRRFEGTGGGTHSNMVRYAGMGANPALAASTMGLSVAGGALVGLAKAAIDRHAPSAFTDFRVEDGADAIDKAFREFYGRPATEQEITEALVGQGWDPDDGDRWVGEKSLNYVLGQIKNNAGKEQADREALLAQMGGGEASASRVTPGAERVDGGGPAATGAGGDWSRLEGFEHDKLNSGHDSPKYQVGRVLAKYPPTPEGLKQALPELQALGLGDVTIAGSKGDKLAFSGQTDPRFQGVTTFDVIRAAGEGGKAWQWMGEDGGGGGQAPSGASPAAANGPVDIAGRVGRQPDVIDGDTLARLQAELARILSGQPDRQALMAQMGGANG